MSDHGRLLLEPSDHAGVVLGNLSDRLVREDLGIRVGLLHGLGIVRPPGGHRCVARLVEDRGPAVPAARQQPEAVYEHDGSAAGRIGLVDLFLGRRRGGNGHVFLLSVEGLRALERILLFRSAQAKGGGSPSTLAVNRVSQPHTSHACRTAERAKSSAAR